MIIKLLKMFKSAKYTVQFHSNTTGSVDEEL